MKIFQFKLISLSDNSFSQLNSSLLEHMSQEVINLRTQFTKENYFKQYKKIANYDLAFKFFSKTAVIESPNKSVNNLHLNSFFIFSSKEIE